MIGFGVVLTFRSASSARTVLKRVKKEIEEHGLGLMQQADRIIDMKRTKRVNL